MIAYIKRLIRLITRKSNKKSNCENELNEKHEKESKIIITSQDIRAIAGEDVMHTQLDLAKAYIELGKNKLAKKILQHVLQNGNTDHKKAAEQLIANL